MVSLIKRQFLGDQQHQQHADEFVQKVTYTITVTAWYDRTWSWASAVV
jgi:hypothetical protein